MKIEELAFTDDERELHEKIIAQQMVVDEHKKKLDDEQMKLASLGGACYERGHLLRGKKWERYCVICGAHHEEDE